MHLKGAHSIAYHTVGQHNTLRARLLKHAVHGHRPEPNLQQNRIRSTCYHANTKSDSLPSESLRTDSVSARPRQRRGAGRSYIQRVNTYVLVTTQTSESYFSGGARRPASATRRRASRSGRTPSSPGYADAARRASTTSASTVLVNIDGATLEIYFSGGGVIIPLRLAAERVAPAPGYADAATPGSSTTSASTFVTSTSIAQTCTCRVTTRLDHLETRPRLPPKPTRAKTTVNPIYPDGRVLYSRSCPRAKHHTHSPSASRLVKTLQLLLRTRTSSSSHGHAQTRGL